MKIFILGRTGSGKTPLARMLSACLDMAHIGGSEWVRARFKADPGLDRVAFTEAITAFTAEEVRREPSVCTDFIRRKYDLSKPCVIEGLRSPHDFVKLFDSSRDAVVFLERYDNDLPATAFERDGIRLILSYVRFLLDRGLMAKDPERVIELDLLCTDPPDKPETARHWYDCKGRLVCYGLASAAELLAARIKGFGEASVEAKDDYATVHVEITPIRAMLREEFLFDGDPAHVGKRVPCSIFAISSYPGNAPTFKVLLDDGSVFSYVPPHALTASGSVTSVPLDLEDLVYHDCPSAEISVSRFGALAGPIEAYFKRRGFWLKGEYLLTIDWYLGNDLLHLVLLENGQFAFLPHHKLKFGGGERSFPPYKKLRGEWKA
jgi:hypothetical protein